ncbi:PREDICTED: uncharacterized protein LOC108358278 isoform X1 [Rhagoletis zephyria]|uniref:uncharacterized protein LOC108358278 isoform X1 n=2 Tax=Rhagoletis zephyria TaxID=28612 RepID=UPI0008119803|nr:PREDICTED: uncharacterized protein LOC108358278 isoform X1 [Rhagoletis zephyria]
MSGLEKFQANKAWRAKVKKLLVMQRNLTPPIHVPVQSTRFSLDLAEDLQVFLEEKIIPREGSSHCHSKYIPENMFETENDENKPINSNSASRCNSGMKNFSTRVHCDETMLGGPQQVEQFQCSSDESFMALEKMCDKTVSDPDSTLYQYTHSDDKELIVENAKKRSSVGTNFKTPSRRELTEIDEEAKSLQRLLLDLCVDEQKLLENETPLKCVDVTQLEDIEAPSKLWDTTIVGESILQTSPVKMVGLLRPSTIMEECGEDDSNNSSSAYGDVSSHVSFQSAVKGSETSATSYYETGHDSTGTSAASKVSHIPDDNAMKYAEPFDTSFELISLDKTLEAPQQHLATAKEHSNFSKSNLERESPTLSLDSSEEVIELLSDEELDEEEIKIQQNSIENKCGLNNMNKELIDLEISFENDNKENCGIFNESGEQSLHFNDTMEEVEYMMKKGMQYMAAAEPSKSVSYSQSPILKEIPIVQPTMIIKPLQEKERTFTFSPKKQNSNWSSPKKVNHSKPTAIVTGTKAKTPVSTPKRTLQTSAQKNKRFVMDMKPMPKLELFKKPVSAIPSRLKEPTGRKQFSHIISPVGAYMKKTATTPLMTNLRQRSEHPDVHNATVFRELEQETKVFQPKFGSVVNKGPKTSSLPKKAYISSEFKHIVDERSPVTIPGGKKIQKYLENAMLPAVVRHEGKLKMSAKEANRKAAAQKASFGNTSQGNNGSLANLSLMSGDISLYTMKDAQKF